MPYLSKAFLFCLAWCVFAPSGWAVEPTPARQTELRHLLKNDCGACHGLTLQGGMGPPLLPDTLKGKADALLITSILQGRKGTAMPPWQAFINTEEAAWLLDVLRNGKHGAE